MPIAYLHRYEFERYALKEVSEQITADIPLLVHHRVQGVRMTASVAQKNAARFQDMVEDVAFHGDVGPEAFDIFKSDFILHGEHLERKTPLSSCFDIKYELDSEQIRRARKTADLLETVFGGRAIPYAVGRQIEPEAYDLANTWQVRFHQVPDLFYYADPPGGQ